MIDDPDELAALPPDVRRSYLAGRSVELPPITAPTTVPELTIKQVEAIIRRDKQVVAEWHRAEGWRRQPPPYWRTR